MTSKLVQHVGFVQDYMPTKFHQFICNYLKDMMNFTRNCITWLGQSLTTLRRLQLWRVTPSVRECIQWLDNNYHEFSTPVHFKVSTCNLFSVRAAAWSFEMLEK